ncbi:hypothetical protein LCGC14_0258430 [marine sediment metagenome]|uniref:Uncharacterized protein n=1 Tax=marine sediment metagenome TaxID=412755 RepID=A0A0F9X744_9ZZZZ
MPDVKEHPQLFKAEMILAILAGLKTMTRRAVTQNNSLIDGSGKGIRAHWPKLQWDRAWPDSGPTVRPGRSPSWRVPCLLHGGISHRITPRVKAGHSLWCKETWKLPAWDGDRQAIGVCYRATGDKTHWIERADHLELATRLLGRKWRSPLHMRRAFARLVLPVVRVGAERLQEISEADALADGGWEYGACPIHKSPVSSFEMLWNSINGDRPGLAWKDNVPLWIYEWEKKQGDRPCTSQ